MPAGRPAAAQVWVDIDAETVLVGQLFSHRRRNVESASFTYDPSYLADRRAYPLDPALPLVSGTLQTPTNQRIFSVRECRVIHIPTMLRDTCDYPHSHARRAYSLIAESPRPSAASR